jgi:PncC family amidohydrolase
LTEAELLLREVDILSRVAVYMGSRMAPQDGRLFSFAESCTGGLVASSVVSVPGASASFPGGVVTYSNEAKTEKLSVSPRVIEKYGAVSGQCAAGMARGALAAFGVRIAVSVTGIAGPDGGSPEKPVGTVWFGLAREDGPVRVVKGFYPGRTRKVVRLCATRTALRLLVRGLCEIRRCF